MTSPSDDEELRLTSGARQLGVELTGAHASLLLRYLDRLYTWNRSAGLTTIARSDAVRLHLLDSLSVVPHLHASKMIADLGSGGGLPGIPIAVVRPDAKVILVEARRRKASFLAETARELGCSNCEVVHGKAQELRGQERGVDTIVARAFLPARALAELGRSLLGQGGKIVIMGARRDADLDDLGADQEGGLCVEADRTFTLPEGDERRRVLVLRRDR